MRKNLQKFTSIIFATTLLLLQGCGNDDRSIAPIEDPLVGFNIPKNGIVFSPGDTENKSIDLFFRLTNPASSDVTIEYLVDETSSANTTGYILGANQIVIPAGEVIGELSITAVANEILTSDPGALHTVIIDIINVSGADVVLDQENSRMTVEITTLVPEIIFIDYQALGETSTTNAGTVWPGAFELQEGSPDSWYGLFYQTGGPLPGGESYRIKLESYQKSVVGERSGDDLFITPIAADALINSESNFNTPANGWPDLPTVSGATYTDWAGQTAYIGIQFQDANFPTLTNYGWLEVEVSADGQQMTLLRAAYRLVGIRAGQTE